MRVGFIGIGNMGWPMARNLVTKGFQVTVFDAEPGRSQRFTQECGGAVAGQLTDLAANDVIVTMLPTGQIVCQVLTGGGDNSLARSLKPGTVVIEMSSSEPTGTQQLGAQLAHRQVTLIDAPVSGGVPRAQSGKLAIMIGGDDGAAIERVKPVLSAMGDRLFMTGPLGSGHAMKALNNYIAAACFTATAEAILVGEKFGLDPEKMVDIVNVSTGRNFHTDVVMKEHVLSKKFATGFSVGLLAKDVKIASDLATAVGIDAPLSKLIVERWASARDRLGANRDNTEAILAWSSGASSHSRT